ncbi:MAG: hypothetical protein C4528_00270 [Gammaproteobacteria bacterium]|nr:MAG: hypothetical protein C4528_00270 [Gammaproteobacteria bacterium]
MATASSRVLVLAVIIPEISASYRDVLTEIVKGIEAQPGARVQRFLLRNNLPRLAKWLEEQEAQGAEAVIALGWRSIAAARGLRTTLPVIAGAAILNPHWRAEGLSGITLRINPNFMLRRLRLLAPVVRQVHMVHDTASHGCLVEEAQAAAARMGLGLFSYPVSNAPGARVRTYQALLDQGFTRHDAVWLCEEWADGEQDLILAMLLEAAWDSGLAVFSENPAHTGRGALFAVLPDYTRLGGQLAQMARLRVKYNAPPAIIPLPDAALLINLRMAQHLRVPDVSAFQTELQSATGGVVILPS